MDPGQDAIALTGSGSEAVNTLARLRREMATLLARPRSEFGEIDPQLDVSRTLDVVREARRRMEQLNQPSGDSRTQTRLRAPQSAGPTRFGPRPEPSHHRLSAARWQSQPLSRSDFNSADASTTLGRRVAARTASGQSSSTNASQTLRDNPAETANEILARAMRYLAEHDEQMNAMVQRARSASVPPAASGSGADASQSGDQPRGEDNGEAERSSRMLSPLFLNISPSPQTAPQTDPLDAPAPLRSSQTSQSVPTQTRPPNVRLSQAPPPEEIAQPIGGSSSWMFGEERALPDLDDDDPFSWLLPSRSRDEFLGLGGPVRTREPYRFADAFIAPEERRRRDRAGQSMAYPQTTLSSRSDADIGQQRASRRPRRGWARLDPDGDEIPTDEEEEYERHRAQLRARALQLTSGQASRRFDVAPLFPEPPPHQRRPLFMPTTQSVWQFSNDEDIQVRINPALPSSDSLSDWERPITPREDDNESLAPTEIIPRGPPSPELIGSSIPFSPSPLPLPLIDLSPLKHTRHRKLSSANRRIKVSSAACLAGR
ncbi:uncharacterized protein LAESUDRAFT_759427 [Laetiporus sulphureus 93-53]|uniref:Uncharacterized protein n=1 Tax=Laetiporus sulphureus 93-53 TaxID=1314785 RepID=A0A165E4M2_9APHY|nr:uncharacterized protein LAESUDRAFT_759427 [Laetiporus sulphureus 93-53]KZT06230.1 hypothetical protein LAESUDRAFT_759427 [Laetiporus sulphureus 93-53]